MIALAETADGVVVISVQVRAAARRNGIAGVHDGALRIDVTAAPEKGKANRAVIAALSDLLGVSRSQIAIVSGDTNPRKRVAVTGLKLAEAQRMLEQAIGPLNEK
jgi:uncharacterized protein (TIGR00251 family)